jgi:hypothetical protein
MAIVTACMRPDGLPTFVLNEVVVSQDEIDNGIHYYLAEAQLMIDGYDEPYVHFDPTEAPPFLHAAVRQHLASESVVINPPVPVLAEAN